MTIYKNSYNMVKYYHILLTSCVLIQFNNNYFYFLLIGKLDEDDEIDEDEMPDNPDDQI